MRYRIEVMAGEPIVRNVETDVILGTVVGSGYDAREPDLKAKFDDILTSDGNEIGVSPRRPLDDAMSTIAFNETHRGYPGFRNCQPRPDAVRVEFALGNLIADAVSAAARGVLEHQAGSLRWETGARFADLTSEIFDIRWGSIFGSFNSETRQDELYFADVWSDPRTATECKYFAGASRM